MANDFDPFDAFRQKLEKASACTAHPPVARSRMPEEAALWYETVKNCPTEARREHLRWLARHDLFFLLVYLLHRTHFIRDQRTAAWTFARCNEVQDGPNNHLDVWTRATFKSEIITFGLVIQDILNDPDITFGFFSHTRPIAKAFLNIIKREFETNEELKDLFPDVLWADPKLECRRASVSWSEDDGITVKRPGNPKEATIEAWGLVDGQPTSKRYRVLMFDDVVARDETSDRMIEKTNTEFMNSLLLTASDPPIFRYVGTPQEIGDTTQYLIDNHVGMLRKHPTLNSEQVSECLSDETIAWFKKNLTPKVFALQILLDPSKSRDENEVGFHQDWLDWYYEAPPRRSMNVYILVDPAGNKPGSNSRFCMDVVGVCADKRVRWLDGVWDKYDLEEAWQVIFAAVQKWEPLKVGYECYGMQRDIDHYRYRMKEVHYEFTIIPLSNTALSKDQQIGTLIPWFRDRRWLFPKAGIVKTLKDGTKVDLVKQFVEREYLLWPYTKLKDMLDTKAHITRPELGVIYPRSYGAGGYASGERASQGGDGGGGSWMAG